MLTPEQAQALWLQQQQQAAALVAQGGIRPVPGASTYPPSFTYGMDPAQRALGAGRLSSPFLGTVGALPTIGTGVGIAAGIGSMFAPGSASLGALSYLDPFQWTWSSGMARFGAARAAGMGFGGAAGAGLAGAALPAALGAAAFGTAAYTGSQFMRGGQEQQLLNAQLAGLGFANPMAPTGRGFGYRQLRDVGAMMREFEAADPFTTMRDMNRMMDQFMGFGMAQGVNDAREFARKFTEFTDSVRDIATTMGTSLDNAARTFQDIRLAGFYSARDVMGNVFQMQIARSLGMDEQVFTTMQAGAAQGTRAANMTGRAGAIYSARLSRDLLTGAQSRAAGGLGLYTPEELMDITGSATPAEAAAVMGGQFTTGMTRFLRGTGAGRAFLAGMGEMREGRFTGRLDPERLARFAAGEVSLAELSRVGGERMARGRGKASFLTEEHNIASALMESERGFEAVFSAIEGTAREHFRGQMADDDAVMLFISRLMDTDQLMAEKLKELLQHRDEIRGAAMQKLQAEQAASAFQLEMRRNRTFAGLQQRIRGTIEDIFAPVRQAGADVGTQVEELGQRAEDVVFGVERYSLTPQAQRDFAMRMATGRAFRGALTPVGEAAFPRGSAAREMARMMRPEQALQFRAGLRAGRPVDIWSFEATLGETQFRSVAAALRREGQADAVGRIVTRIQEAQARGDEDAAEAALVELRSHVTSNLMGSLQGYGTWRGNVEQVMAMAATASGADDVARGILLRGDVETTAFTDAKESRKKVLATARAAGLSHEQAEALAGGGPGAAVIAYLGEMEERGQLGGQRAIDVLDNLANTEAGRRRLSGKVGAARFEELGAMLAEMPGGRRFAGEEIEAAVGMARAVTPEYTAPQYSRTGRLVGRMRERRSRADVFRGLALDVGGRMDVQALLGLQAGARASIAAAPEEVREALGPAFEELAAAVTGTPSAGAMMRAAGGVIRAVEGGALEGVAGGAQLRAVMGRREEALTALRRRRSLQDVFRGYGITGTREEILSTIGGLGVRGVDLEDDLSSGETRRVIEALARRDVLSQLGAGGRGGIWTRGETAEMQLAIQMGKTADKVSKMSEAVDMVYTKVRREHSGFFSESPVEE